MSASVQRIVNIPILSGLPIISTFEHDAQNPVAVLGGQECNRFIVGSGAVQTNTHSPLAKDARQRSTSRVK